MKNNTETFRTSVRDLIAAGIQEGDLSSAFASQTRGLTGIREYSRLQAQIKCYGHMVAVQRNLKTIDLQLTCADFRVGQRELAEAVYRIVKNGKIFFARDYYFKRSQAMAEMVNHDIFDQALMETMGQTYQICPFGLSLDISLQCDVIFRDLNYAFDPRVFLKRFF